MQVYQEANRGKRTSLWYFVLFLWYWYGSFVCVYPEKGLAAQTLAGVCKLPPDKSIMKRLKGLKVQEHTRPRHVTAVKKHRLEPAMEQQTVEASAVKDNSPLAQTTEALSIYNKNKPNGNSMLLFISMVFQRTGGFLLSWRLFFSCILFLLTTTISPT